MLVFIFAISVTGIYKMNVIGLEMKAIAKRDMPLTEILSQITIHQLEQAMLLEQSLRLGGVDASQEGHTAEKSVQHFKELAAKVDEEIIQAEKMTEAFVAEIDNPEMKKKFENVFAQLKTIETRHKSYDEHAFAVFEMAGIGTGTSAQKINKEMAPRSENEIRQGPQAFYSLNNQRIKQGSSAKGSEDLT
tara:strand:+ start:2461 stop:3030 length:570 start_codon:yes stop_codon:yes gene_type:complete